MNLKQSLLAPAAIAMLVYGCGPKPSGETAETGEAMEVADATASAETFTVDTNLSKVTWNGYKPTGKHNGTINISDGSIAVEGSAISSASFTIDITSLTVLDIPADDESNGKLTGHLMSDDFFDAENHPTATFEVVDVAEYAADMAIEDKEQFETEFTPASASEIMVANPTHMITGNLTMRGVTKSVSFPAAVTLADGGVTATANFNIDRTAWNLAYGDEANAVDKAKDKFIYNTVNVGFELTATAPTSATM
ncbi:MAG: YceI family protein [Cyclobacteriaceae bacterium]